MNATVQSQQRNIQIGFLLATGAALGFSMKAIFVKLAYAYHVDAITMLMFALPFFIVIVWLEERKAKNRIRRKDFISIILLGLVGYYCSSLLDFMGLMYISAGLERLILFLFPTMVVFISAIFLGKRIPKEAYIALVLSYMGIIVAMVNDVQISGEHVLLGSALVFAATITYSVFLVGSGEVIPKVGARRFAAYAMIVSCIAVFIQFGITRDIDSFNQPQRFMHMDLPWRCFPLCFLHLCWLLPCTGLAQAKHPSLAA